MLRSDDLDQVRKSAKRLKVLPEFANASLDEILQHDIKRKQALSVIAIEKGFESWPALKSQLPFVKGGFLNHWFANYEEAKSKQLVDGGYLLPYQKQFFIVDDSYIENLGFDISDPDWKSIGYDWAKPDDIHAWKRLYRKWRKIQEKENG
tara:strand:+ start:998 stop:1447 length:450 start_codon:yes stop_codon:yes gene_type:complete